MFGKKDDLTNEQVMKALDGVVDPILERGIVELEMVGGVAVDDKRVRLDVRLPAPGWAPKAELQAKIEGALDGKVGERNVEIDWGLEVRPSRPGATGGQNLIPGARNIVLFASGKGGVGKSTVAANVATALANLGAKVGLLDADIYGPSVPMLFGTKQMPDVAPTGDKLTPVEQHGLRLMSIGFVVEPKDAMSWRGPMLNGALLQFMRDVDWGELDYLCLDLPPGTGDIQLTIAQNVKVAGAILVSTPQDVALADVTRAKAMFDRVDIPTLGVVENMSSFTCTKCEAVHHIFDHGGAARLASELGLPVLGEIPIELGVRESSDRGTPEVIANPDSRVSQVLVSTAKRIATEIARRAVIAHAPAHGKGGSGLRIVQ